MIGMETRLNFTYVRFNEAKLNENICNIWEDPRKKLNQKAYNKKLLNFVFSVMQIDNPNEEPFMQNILLNKLLTNKRNIEKSTNGQSVVNLFSSQIES